MRKVFPRLFGNEPTKHRIGDAILSGRLPHALLIDGGEGSGRLTLAKSIAAAVNCERRDDAGATLPCHECPTCKRIFADTYTDMHILSTDDGRTTIGVDPVKDMRRDMFLTATEARQKVYIIREAEKLTPAAQNALLIVLEEPPKDVLVMLLASGTDKILTTIKSRAQYIALSRFTRDEISEHLLNTSSEARSVYESDREGFLRAISASDGRIGLAEALISPERREALAEERAETLALIDSLGRGNSFREVYRAVGELPSKRAELSEALERVMLALGDLIKTRYDSTAEPIFYESREAAEATAARIGQDRLFKIYDVISSAYDANSKNANTAALTAELASRLKRA